MVVLADMMIIFHIKASSSLISTLIYKFLFEVSCYININKMRVSYNDNKGVKRYIVLIFNIQVTLKMH